MVVILVVVTVYMIGGRSIVGEFVVLILEWVMENGMRVSDAFVNQR